jgi:hypothetical protein
VRTPLALALGLLVGCDPASLPAEEDPPGAESNPVAEALARLREHEPSLRGRERPPWSSVSGADPSSVAPWGEGFVGLLRGASAVVRLDAQGRELARLPGPEGAVGWARAGNTLHVVGERSPQIQVIAVDGDDLRIDRIVRVEGVTGLRAVDVEPQGWLVADRHRGRVLRVDAEGTPTIEVACAGALDVRRAGAWVVANCLLEHTVRVFDADGLEPIASVTHDGPIWAMEPRVADEGLEIVLAGVEDHPLERRDGSFGYIDSFVFRLRLEGDVLRRLDAVNVGEHGVVTPKFVTWDGDAAWVSGAGGDAVARIVFEPELVVDARPAPAGVTGLAPQGSSLLAADPLLDRWVRFDPDAWTLVDVPGEDSRPEAVRVGEALVFTTLIAPQASAQGRGSRFTCETCHFEGTVDGRVHYTGRGEVHATTKTLRGLVGNQPHFSRALDDTTTDMIHNEFRVANANTPQDPWFSVEVASVPWLGALSSADTLGPEELRAAMLEFLAVFTPERNPGTLGQTAFSSLERRGASRFEALCETCHQARTVADDPQSRLPFEAWESAVFGDVDILWASDERHRTGVEPYVHADGPRVPSLRRLWVKRPYLTQGGAPDVLAVLADVRLDVDAVHGGGEGTPLSEDDQEALAAFLDLL